MSLANSKRSQVVAWLSCQAVWDEIEHAPHSHIDKLKTVQCAGYTEEGTNIASKALASPPTVWFTGSGQYMLTNLSEGHLTALLDALLFAENEGCLREGSEEIIHALYDI